MVLIPISVLALVLLLHYLFTRSFTGRIGRLGRAMTQARGGTLRIGRRWIATMSFGVIAQIFNETMNDIEKTSRERDPASRRAKDL